MTVEELHEACRLIEERGVDGFDADVNLAVMALAEAVMEGEIVHRRDAGPVRKREAAADAADAVVPGAFAAHEASAPA